MSDANDPPPVVRVGLIQHACAEQKADNLATALRLIDQAVAADAQIVCLQELFAGRYPCQREDHDRFAEAEPIPGPTSAALADAAKRHEIVIVGSIWEQRAAGMYHNTAIVVDADGRLCGTYRKMHIPDDPLYYEKFYFAPGDLGFRSFPTRFGRVGVGVCWDQWFPEAARLTALSGAEFLFYPTAIGWLPDEKQKWGASQHNAWETMMRSHAIANGLFVGAANRCGREDALEFWGASFMADPYGNVMERAGHQEEQVLVVTCDRRLIEAARTHWPFFRDRRIDAYQGLLQRWLDERE